MPEKTAAARKTPARLGDLEDVFAGKGETVAALAEPTPQQRPVTRGGGRSAPVEPVAVPAPEPEEEREPLITTLRIPGYLAENIRRWLFENPGHSQHSMVFAGLAKLGIEVREEDLEPRRRPRSARHR